MSELALNMERLIEGCFWIRGSDFCSNIYFLKDEAMTIVIDTGDGSVELKEKADYCFLTHGHADHTGGTRKDWDCFLRKEDFRNDFPFSVPDYVKPLDSNKLKIGSFDLEIINTPGHTQGSICIFEKNRRVLFTGDTLFSDGWIGRTDFPGGSEEKMHSSLIRLLSKFAKTKSLGERIEVPVEIDPLGLELSFICSGHGEPRKL